jgi:hypothetical protein
MAGIIPNPAGAPKPYKIVFDSTILSKWNFAGLRKRLGLKENSSGMILAKDLA